LFALPQQPSVVHVGSVTAVYWSDEATAIALAELADRGGPWPGIPQPPTRRIRLVIATDDAQFDSITAGRLPEWGAAAAFPGSRTIVLRVDRDHRRLLRHELAHLALHSVVRRVPRWFDEGYAALAAAEWDQADVLRVNWIVLRGVVPTLAGLDRHIREGGAVEAEASYALATTAVRLLEHLGGERGLEPLITTLRDTPNFDAALRGTYQITLGQFEAMWRRDLRKRYGWLLIFSSVTLFWAFVSLLLMVLWARRRQRDRERRQALENGWFVPEDEWNPNA
jgi:hypothetical protein